MDFSQLRLQQMFGNLFPAPQVQSQFPQSSPMSGDFNPTDIARMPQDPNDPNGVIAGLMQPQNTAQNQLTELLNNAPQRENYKPSRMTNILGRIAGLGASGPAGTANGQMIGYKSGGAAGQKITDDILNKGYNEARESWADKLRPINDLAQSERAANTNNRLIGQAMISDKNKDAELARKTAKDEAQAKLEADKLAEKREFLAYLDYKSKHPNHVYKSDREGYVYSIDPQTDTVAYPADPEGNRMRADKLPEMEKLQIENNNRLGQIKASAAAQGAKEINVAQKTEPIKERIKTTIPGKNTAPVEKPESTKKTIKVWNDKGVPGTIPEDKLKDAINAGYTVR